MTTTPGDHDQTIAIQPKGVHFLVCVHGMWGLPDHLQRVEETIQAKFADTDKDTELITLRARTNADSHTYDGLDWGAERVVKEVYETVAEIEQDGLKKVTKFSIFGYSLGGLISRYAIGILYQRGFFRTIKPVNFTTFATPHIGLPRYRGFLGSVMHKLGPVMLSRTGRQFYGTDKDIWSPDDKEGRPLIEVMADPELIFFKALKSFPNITFYGNAIHDLTVVYCTSLAEPYDPFAALKTKSHRLAIKMDPEYKHVIQYFGEVPEGEVVPLSEIDQEDKDRKAALPWYSPSRYRSSRPLRPPFRKLPLPLDILLTIAFPFLIPIGLAYAVVRFQRESRASERRLKDLTESPESESSLGTVLRKMEMAMTDMVNPDESDDISRRQSADWQSDLEEGTVVVEDETRKRRPGRAGTPEAGVEGGLPTPALTPSTTPTPDPISTNARWPAPTPKPDDPNQPMLTPAQLAMIESLNSLPQLKKVRAYFPFVRNAHSVIIVRDPKMFAEHELGQGVVNHWADRFVL